ncbi:ABC transporter substrate-binding protein [Rhodothermus bifroesti]|uniref:ABC transporter substrate-binding protein n=1 Tax=Rhodothermus bifroesti TaxID=2823335 RepID=UPI000CB1A217|nr:Outer membrane protein assembly factor BamD [bacterium HR18]
MGVRHWIYRSCGTLFGLLLALSALETAAQRTEIPRIEAAESEFAQALEAFERGNYGLAYRQFRHVVEAYPLHRKTTAAWIMAAKALYRLGEYEQVRSWLEAFRARYPTSKYLAQAQQLEQLAEAAQAWQQRQAQTITLGILLPIDAENAVLTQSLFDGIRLAVAARNADSLLAPVRMVFRDAGTTPAQVQAALRSLVQDQKADLVIGPLYSEQAIAAAEVAEQLRVVLIAPLATDAAVSRGRRWVFQANPTLSVRGQLMARMAVYGLRLRQLGVAALFDDPTTEHMAEAFQAEALRLGAHVVFYKLLPNAQAYGNLVEQIGQDTLRQVEALYLPLSGAQAPALGQAALSSLERAGVSMRILGNAAWREVQAPRQASRYQLTFSNDFWVDSTRAEVRSFQQQYQALRRQQPDRLAYVGYDVARFLLQHLPERSALGDLPDRLREAPPYQGLGVRLHFEGGQVNRALYFHRYRDGRLELLR